MRPQLWAFRISLLLCVIIPIATFMYVFGGDIKDTVLYVLAAVFILSALVVVISTVDISRNNSRKTAQAWVLSLVVILSLPFVSCGLLYFATTVVDEISTTVTSFKQHDFDPYYDLNSHPSSTQPHQPAIPSTPTPTPSQTASLDYQKNGVLIPNLYRSSQHHRPISGISLKPNADFGNTFTGQSQFIITATNQFSGQAIGIDAIYTEACAAQWQRYPNSTAPDHLAKVGAALIAGDLPYGEYQCIGLQLSAPLKVGQLYIGIDTHQTGSPVELAELPQLVKVIENARPN